jgi:tetratricopeptide (TPR) repeat protein
MHLDGGLRYEQAGLARKAIAAYESALTARSTPLERAEAQLRLARVHRAECEWDAAVREARVAVRLADAAGSDDLAAEAMNVEVGVYQLRGDLDAAEALAVAALTRARTPRVRGILLQNRGAVAAQRRDFVAAQTLFAESVEAFERAGYELGMAIALNNASAAARDAGDPPHALELAEEAAALARRLGAFDILTLAVQNQAYALIALGRADEAEAPLGEVLGHYTATCNVLRQAECLEVMGSLYALRPGERETAERCYELARTLAARVGAHVLSGRVAERLAELAPSKVENSGDGQAAAR